jgi:hypothetical protein
MKVFSCLQIKENLSEKANTTLKYDGTTKKSHHIMEVEVATVEGKPYLLGLKQTPGGEDVDYTGVVVSSVGEVQKQGDESDTSLLKILQTQCLTIA